MGWDMKVGGHLTWDHEPQHKAACLALVGLGQSAPAEAMALDLLCLQGRGGH